MNLIRFRIKNHRSQLNQVLNIVLQHLISLLVGAAGDFEIEHLMYMTMESSLQHLTFRKHPICGGGDTYPSERMFFS